MKTTSNIFPKKSRLKSRKKLQEVFAKGNRIYAGAVKILYIIENTTTPHIACGVGMSGRFFKKAVDRNRIKRLLREAYRLQQHALQNFALEQHKEISLFFLYTGKELPDYTLVFETVGVALQKLLTSLYRHSIQHDPIKNDQF